MRSARALIPIFLVLSGCAGSARVSASGELGTEAESANASESESSPTAQRADAGANAQAAEAPKQAEGASPVSPVDPEAAQAAVQKTGQAGADAALGLRFEVVEQGPNQPWVLAVVNRGTERVSVVFDSRLLSIEVQPAPPPEPDETAKKKKVVRPAKPPKPTICKLPAGIVPTTPEPALVEELEPSEGLVQSFDPRLYCMPKDGKSVLTSGARVLFRFGWPEKTKTVWQKGGRVNVPVEQSPPFVASPVESAKKPAETEKTAAEADASAKGETPERRVKELRSSEIVLGDAYAVPLRKPAEDDLPFELKIVRGSDALDESYATVTTSLRNRSKTAQKVFFRREFLSFEVAGPEGFVGCAPTPDDRAPDRSAFSTLRPGGDLRVASRLAELCPLNTFGRPGLYLIHARADLPESGAEHRMTAFTGRVATAEPAVIRIRKGEMPFVAPSTAVRVRVGETASE